MDFLTGFIFYRNRGSKVKEYSFPFPLKDLKWNSVIHHSPIGWFKHPQTLNFLVIIEYKTLLEELALLAKISHQIPPQKFSSDKSNFLVMKRCAILTLGIVNSYLLTGKKILGYQSTVISISLRFLPKSAEINVSTVIWEGLAAKQDGKNTLQCFWLLFNLR